MERNLTEVNASWVRDFYCNYFKSSLDAVHLRGKQILVTEEAIEDILRLQPKSDQPDGYQKAEDDMCFLRFDWDAVNERIAFDPTIPWVMGKNTVMPKGIKLIFFAAADKYDLYYPYITDKRGRPENPFFMKMREVPGKEYVFADAMKPLREALGRGEQDVYWLNDTHWSHKGIKIFCDELVRYILPESR